MASIGLALKFLGSFRHPRRAFWAIVLAAFTLAMLFTGDHMGDAAGDLVRSFAGVLALLVGTGFLARGGKAMRNHASNFGLLLGTLALIVLGVGIVQIIVAGASDYSKELAAVVGGAAIGLLDEEEG